MGKKYQTATQYTIRNQDNLSQTGSSNSLWLKGLLGLGVVVTSFLGFRWFQSPQIPLTPRLPLKNCDTNNIIGLTMSPGSILLPTSMSQEISLKYPYQDIVEGWTETAKQQNYLKAMHFLSNSPPINTLSISKFTTFLNTLHSIILPKEKGQYRTTWVYIIENDDLRLFDDSSKLTGFLEPDEIMILQNIKRKIDAFINEYIEDFDRRESIASLRETIVTELAGTGKLTGMDKISKKYQLTEEEKRLVNDYYSFKPEYSAKQMEDRLQQGFRKLVGTCKGDPAKFAAHLHMLIVDIHPYKDGNGKLARALQNAIRKEHNLPPVILPSRTEYMHVVHEASNQQNYDIYSEFVAKLEQEKHFETVQETCLYLYQPKNDCRNPSLYSPCLTYLKRMQEESAAKTHYAEYRRNKNHRKREIRKK